MSGKLRIRRFSWRVVVLCPVLLTVSATAAPAGRHTAAAQSSERCCFLLDVSVDSYLGVEYPCSSANAGCASGPRYPNGGHFFKVDWYGREIVSYRMQNGRPTVGEVFAGQARLRVTEAVDSGAWARSANAGENESCALAKSSNPKEFDSSATDGFMKSWSLLEFVDPTTLEVHAGPGLDNIFGTRCGLGADRHAVNGSRAAWGGLNEPWVWTFPSWSAQAWTTESVLSKVVSANLKPRVLQHGDFCWDTGTGSRLTLFLTYFPPAELEQQAKAMDAQFPITASRLRTFENYVHVGVSDGPGSELCDG